jgi:PilZ domain-containing protein
VFERRQMTRYDFGAIAEVIDLDSRQDVIAVTRDLSSSGCFVKTNAQLPTGTTVMVRIRALGEEFAAKGNVTGNQTWEGMGIEFVEIQPKDQAIIEQWLDPKPRQRQELSIAGIPVTVFGELSTGAFTEETETQMTASDRGLLRLEAAVSPGQVVRLRNRLTRQERDCRVVSVDPQRRTGRPKLLAVQFLNPARNFWHSRKEAQH